MDSQSAMAAALVDPQLEMMRQSTAAEGMQYQYPLPTSATTFEPWNSMFESIGEFPQTTQNMATMESDPFSDETSSGSFSLGAEQDMQFPLSPLGGPAGVDESPGATSISTGLSEAGSKADKKAPKAATKAKKTRRRRSETEKKEQIKQRNRVAASKCRLKKKEKVDELKEMKSSLEARNNALHMEYQRLRQEIGRVKSDLIHHTDCNDPNINRWVENEAKGYVEKLVRNDERQRMGSIGSLSGASDAYTRSVHETAMSSADPYMGLS
ncbi:hypothetical protein V8C35DRAFT_157623 [Trichoderma chlorosporum]